MNATRPWGVQMTDLPRTAFSAIARRPDDLKIFLQSMPSQRSARVGQGDELAGASDYRIAEGAVTSVKEILVGAGVMAITAAIGFYAIMAAAT
jgi:hypothetical protein